MLACIDDEPQPLRESDNLHVLNKLGHAKLSEDIQNDEAEPNSDFGIDDAECRTHILEKALKTWKKVGSPVHVQTLTHIT